MPDSASGGPSTSSPALPNSGGLSEGESTQLWTPPYRADTPFNFAESVNPELQDTLKQKDDALSNRLNQINQVYDESQGQGASQINREASEKAYTKGITSGQSISNSLANVVNRLEGVIPRLNVYASDVWEGILGEELTKSWYEFEGRDINQVRSEAYAELDKLNAEVRPTIGVVDSIESGGMGRFGAATVNALTSLISTAVPAAATGGAALFTEMGGEAIVDYNKAKAKSLGVSIEELYSSGQADLKAPLAIGTAGGALEHVGFKGMTNILMKQFTGSALKKGLFIFGQANKEGITEWLQTGLETANRSLGAGESMKDAGQKAADAMTSKQGLEAYLMGILAGGTIGGVRAAVDIVQSQKAKTTITQEIENIGRAEMDVTRPEVQESVSRIADAIDQDDQLTKPEVRQEQKKQDISADIAEAAGATEQLADQLVNATSPQEVAEIKARAEEAGKLGIESTQKLEEITKKELANPVEEVPAPAMGDPITFKTETGEDQSGFIKEILPNDEAIVALNADGIYSEKTISLPKAEEVKTPPAPVEETALSDTPVSAEIAQAEDPIVQPTPKPKRSTRTTVQLGREPASFLDAAHQFFLSGYKLSTDDFIRHTGFGYYKVVDGKKTKLSPEETSQVLKTGKLESGEQVKMSDELRKAKFQGKVANKENGGIDADMINQSYIPAAFSGEQGMDLVTELVNIAANKSKGQMLSELELSNPEVREAPGEETYGYTAEEITEMEDLENGTQDALADEELDALEQVDRGEILNKIYDELASEEITEEQSVALLEMAKAFTDQDGNIDWDALEQKYFDTFISNSDVDFTILPHQEILKKIFEYGNTKLKPKPEESQTASTDSNREVSSENGREGRQGSEQETERADGSEVKIEQAKSRVDTLTNELKGLQKELSKLSDNLSKNLSENQADMFGRNKPQSLFDDKAAQQKIFTDKQAQVKATQEALIKAKEDLSALQETEGQIELSLPDAIVEIHGKETDLSKTSEGDDAQVIAQAFFNPISAMQKAVDRLENKTTARLMPKITDYIAENLKAWRTSKSTIKQVASSLATSVFGGIAKTDQDANVKLGLIGGKNMAVYNMGKMMKSLYGLVDNNVTSLERVHVVLDPDFYQQGLGGQSNVLNQAVPPNLTYKDLTPQEQALHDEVRRNLDDIHFKNYVLGFISVDVFNKHKGTYVPRMYETFELPADVQEELDKYQDQVGGKLNLNPFKKRKGLDDLSDESKNAILKDPVYLVAKRMMELDTNSAIMTYINHINRNNRQMVYKGANPPFNYQKLEGKAYGALDGKYVPSFVAEDLRGYFFVNKHLNWGYDGIKAYDRTWARQGVKKGLTVFNPFVQLGNFTSNVVFAQMAGIDFVRWFGNTANAIKSLKAKDSYYEALLAAGLVGSDTLAKDLRPNTQRANSMLQTAQAQRDAGLLRKVFAPLQKLNDKAMDLYSGNDDYAKINAFQIFQEQGYSEQEALKKVYDGFQNYATVGKFWDVMSKMPVLGNPFMKFSADLSRITANAVTKKPLSTALYVAGLYMMPQLLKELGFSDDDEDDLEKELREGRPFIPKMDLGIVNVPLVYKTKIGELNLARYITPYYFFDNGEDGALSSMMSRFNPVKTVTTQSYGKGNERTLPFGQDPVLGTLYNIMMDTDFRGKSIQDPQATRFRASGVTDEEKWINRTTNALRTWVPNGGLLHDTYLNSKYGEDFYGRTRTMAQALINFAVKIQDFEDTDYKKTAEKQVYSITNDLKSQAETIKNTYATDARQRQRLQESLKDGKIDASDFKNSIEKLDESLRKRITTSEAQLADIKKKLNDFTTKYERILKQ